MKTPNLFLLQVVCLVISAESKSQCSFTLGTDVMVCQGQQFNIPIAGPAGYNAYLWNTGSQNQNINVSTTGTFVCTATKLSGNLVVNGDFNSGNSSFASNYIVGTGGSWGLVSNPGTYAVTTDPNLAHTNFYSFGDHTSGSGKMMVCNGSSAANDIIWSQTINLAANTNYNFSAWVTSVENLSSTSQAAQLQFSINGNLIGAVTSAPLTAGQWLNFFVNWNSGANTTAVIRIVDQNVQPGSNDFALDDIFFQQICEASDTIAVVTAALPNVSAVNPVTMNCSSSTINLSGSSATPGVNFNWSGLGIVSGGNTLTPTVNASGNYIFTVTDPSTAANCAASYTVVVNPPANFPVADAGNSPTLNCNTTSVTLNGSASTAAGVQYNWTGPATGVPAGTNPAGITTTISAAGIYTLAVTNISTGCSATDTVSVFSNTIPPGVDAGTNIVLACPGVNSNLSPALQQTNYTYQWNGPGGFTSSQFNPGSGINATGTYYLTATNQANGCKATDSVIVTANVAPAALLTATPNEGIAPLEVNFTSTSTNANTLIWSFGDGHFAADSTTISNIYFSTGTYSVMLVASNGTNTCNDTAYTTINVITEATVLIPNIFSPNGDDINDEFKVSATWVKNLTIEVFNRWGNKMSSFDAINSWWDGKDANEGTYFYLAKGEGMDGKEINLKGYIMLVK